MNSKDLEDLLIKELRTPEIIIIPQPVSDKYPRNQGKFSPRILIKSSCPIEIIFNISYICDYDNDDGNFYLHESDRDSFRAKFLKFREGILNEKDGYAYLSGGVFCKYENRDCYIWIDHSGLRIYLPNKETAITLIDKIIEYIGTL